MTLWVTQLACMLLCARRLPTSIKTRFHSLLPLELLRRLSDCPLRMPNLGFRKLSKFLMLTLQSLWWSKQSSRSISRRKRFKRTKMMPWQVKTIPRLTRKTKAWEPPETRSDRGLLTLSPQLKSHKPWRRCEWTPMLKWQRSSQLSLRRLLLPTCCKRNSFSK